MGIKRFFQSEWQGVADPWQRWHGHVRSQSAAATEWLLELAEVRPGDRVLDLASGVGDPALALAQRVGERGRVVASDLVAGPLGFIERAAREAGLRWLSTQPADMEELPFLDASFEVVTCRLGLMFCPDLALALQEARRVLVPGGRAAFVVWGSPKQPLFQCTWALLTEALREARAAPVQTSANEGPPADAPCSDAPPMDLLEPAPVHAEPCMPAAGPFRFQRAGSLAGALRRAGFRDVIETERRLPWPFRGSAAEFWEMFLDLGGPTLRAGLDALEPSARGEIEARAIEHASAHRTREVIDPGALLIGARCKR